MADFQDVNTAYCKFFAHCRAPSRSCVSSKSCGGDSKVMLDCIAFLGSSSDEASGRQNRTKNPKREVLHVKSLSRWAPLCIGPYSQANILCDGGLILIAGQIGLDPATMDIIEGGLRAEMIQATANAAAIAETSGNLADLPSAASLLSSGALCVTVYVALNDGVNEGLEWTEMEDDFRNMMQITWNGDDDHDSGSSAPCCSRAEIPIAFVGVRQLPKNCRLVDICYNLLSFACSSFTRCHGTHTHAHISIPFHSFPVSQLNKTKQVRAGGHCHNTWQPFNLGRGAIQKVEDRDDLAITRSRRTSMVEHLRSG